VLSWRITLGVLFSVLLAGLCWLDQHSHREGMWLLPLALLLAAAAAVEMESLVRAGSPHTGGNLTTAACGPLVIVTASGIPILWPAAASSTALGQVGWTLYGFLLTFFAEAILASRRFARQGAGIDRLAGRILRNAYIGLLMAVVVQLRTIAPAGQGMLALTALIGTVKLGDITAYTAGRLWGRRKMAPVLSPGKTWEGAAGGLAGACLGAWLFLVVLAQWAGVESPLSSGRCGSAGWLVFGLLVGSAGMAGDLFESYLKRSAGVKDSSTWLPGFGGVLDLLDSILLASPVAYLIWIVADAMV
jgi:phosphatidate cytidylyltransferase